MYEVKKNYANNKPYDPISEWFNSLKEYLISNYDTYKKNFKKYNV